MSDLLKIAGILWLLGPADRPEEEKDSPPSGNGSGCGCLFYILLAIVVLMASTR